jgi:DNA-binding transcriptional LysR family regulator
MERPVLDLRQFQVLAAIAAEGSLAGAARTLHYGQPTVTHHLAALEVHLGVRLVDRGPRGAALTDIGRLFLGHVEAVLERLDTAENEVRLQGKHGLSTLRVGTFATAGARLLPGAVRHVADQGVRLELIEAEPVELVEQLRRKALHCALVFGLDDDEYADGGELVVDTICDDPYRLVLSADHKLAGEAVIDLADLSCEGWIFGHSEHDPGDRILIGQCEAVGFRPRGVLKTDDYGLMHGFVGAGAAVAVIPALGIDLRANVIVRPTRQDLGSRSIQFARPPGKPAAIVGRLHQALRAHAKKLPATND